MEETRVNKYKEYRAQLIREGSKAFDESKSKDYLSDTLNTQTLPMNEVYDTLEREDQEQENLLALEKKKMILKYTFIGIGLLFVLVGLIFLAILAFKK